MSAIDARARFRELHAAGGVFVVPNPWDVGSAKLLAHAGFSALATTSAGLAWALGRDDYGITRDLLVDHVAAVTAAVDVPVNIDSERCFADDPEGVAATVTQFHEAGAAGCSIEDWNPAGAAIDPVEISVERVAAAAEAAHRDPDDSLVLTARCEHLLHATGDLDAAIARLVAYEAAGADCLYAPGLATVAQIEAVVEAVTAPVNVLLLPGGPTVDEIGAAGGRRVSVGSALASMAYGSMMGAARHLLDHGGHDAAAAWLSSDDRSALT